MEKTRIYLNCNKKTGREVSSRPVNLGKENMKKKNLGNTNISVTPVAMGVDTVGPSKHARAFADGARVVRYAAEQGINFFDASDNFIDYRYLKKALNDLAPEFSQNNLQYPVIASKSLASDFDGMSKAIDNCRSALNLDQIDIFMMMDVTQPDFENRRGAWECLQDAKAKGHIKAAGISTSHADAVAAAAGKEGVDVVFSLLNFQGRGILKGEGEGEKEDMEDAVAAIAENGAGVYAMHVLGGGKLAEFYTKALGYAMDVKGVSGIVLGLGCRQDIDDAVSYFEGRMPEDYMPDLSKPQLRNRIYVDRSLCTKCGACVKYCTNSTYSFGEDGFPFADTKKCIRCGFCLPVCPVQALLFL